MVCRAAKNSYSGDDDLNYSGRNWNGDVRFAPRRLARPKDLKSLVDVVAQASEDEQPLHVIGSGWSFEDCAATDGVLVSLKWLTGQLSYLVEDNRHLLTARWTGPAGGSGPPLVHVEAGISLASLCEDLDEDGLALPTLGGSNGQTLGGVIATSTHGGDIDQPPFPDLVRAIHLVFADGQEVWVESKANPLTRRDADGELRTVLPCPDTKIVRDDHVFRALLVACGRFGVIYSVVLEVRPQFRVTQIATRPSTKAVLKALRDGQPTASAFAPLLTLLDKDPKPAGVAAAGDIPYFLQILFNALRPSDVWATRRWVVTDADLPDVMSGTNVDIKSIAVGITAALHEALGIAAGALAGATATVGEIAGLLIGVPGLGAIVSGTATSTVVAALTETTARLDLMIAQNDYNAGALAASAINSLWKVPGMNQLVAEIERLILDSWIPPFKRGPHHLITSGSRADSEQTDFVSDSLEVVFGVDTTDYLDFLDEVLAVSPLFPVAGYVSMRPSLPSNALLSMHNVAGPRAVSFELASIKPITGNVAWLTYCEHAAVRRGGRPHWGQVNTMQTLDTAALYGDALDAWREGLLTLERIAGTQSTIFSNAFTRQRGLEPVGVARDVTSVRKRHGTITDLCHDGAPWSPVTVAQAVTDIRSGKAHYFVNRNGSRAAIVVVGDGHGGFHLRTRADRTTHNNLDQLPLSSA